MINKIISHFEEKDEIKYLVLDEIDEIKKFQINIKKFGRVFKKKLKKLIVEKK